MTTQPDSDHHWLDLVHAPVFVLDALACLVLRSNAAFRHIMPADCPAAPAPIAAILGDGPTQALLDYLRTMPVDGSRNTLSLICTTVHGPMMLILHLAEVPGHASRWVVTVDERTLFFQGESADNVGDTFRGIIQQLPIGIDLFDASWRAIFYNAYSDSLYLYDSYYDLEHHEWFERAFPDPQDRAQGKAMWDVAQAALEANPAEPQHIEWRVCCSDGEYRTLSNMMCKIGTHYAFIYWDITEQRQLEDRLRQLASTDMLTGVYNRRHFFAAAAAILPEITPATRSLALLLVDIDHFKRVNDNFGHQAGDQALVAVANRCGVVLRKRDVLARFGGEEFAVLLPDTSLTDARQIAEQLLEAVARAPVPTSAGSLQLSVSIGLAAWDEEMTTIDQLIERADAALYAAKRAGRSRVVADRGIQTS